jgi:predicted  nucleic acid-binding Zn-ribbon protein
MKLNPFAKRTGAYLASIKAEHDDLQRRIEDIEDELVDARADYEAASDKNTRLRESAGRLSMNTPPAASAHWPVVTAASQKVQRLESNLSDLKSRIPPLRRLLDAQEDHEKAQAQLDQLNSRQVTLTSEMAKADIVMAKLEKRIADVQSRIAAENQLAAEALIGAEGEFTVPEVLAKLEAELRLAQTAINDLTAKKAAWRQEQDDNHTALRDAEHSLVHARATVIEIELLEKVFPLMDLFARAAVSRSARHWGDSEHEYLIKIPSEQVLAARRALGMPTAD